MGTKADVHGEYKKLISDVASKLVDDDKKCLTETFKGQHRLGSKFTALDIFAQLEKEGVVGPTKIDSLKSILKDIGRSDLVSEYVEPFVMQLQNSSQGGCIPNTTHAVAGPSASPIEVVSCPETVHSSKPFSVASQESSSGSSHSHFSYMRQNMSISSTNALSKRPSTIKEESPLPKEITSSSECTITKTTGFDNPHVMDIEQRAGTTFNQFDRHLKSKEQTSFHQTSTDNAARPQHSTAASVPQLESHKRPHSNSPVRTKIPMAPHSAPQHSRETGVESETSFGSHDSNHYQQSEHFKAKSLPPGRRLQEMEKPPYNCGEHLPQVTSSLHPVTGLDLQEVCTASSEYKQSLLWKINTGSLVKKIRNKDGSPHSKSFLLPVGCYYGHCIAVNLELTSYESRAKRSVSLRAIVTIPQKCSRRRLFVHSCESKYRLSTEISSRGMMIGQGHCMEVMLEPSDDSNVHETVLYLDGILPHEQLLHYKAIDLNVVLQLILLNSRLPQPDVTFFDENDYLGINNNS